MSLAVVMAIGLGGAAGALARAWVGRMIRSPFPVATLVVNVAGSFLLAVLYNTLQGDSDVAQALLGGGFCGAFTTFSTFILETVILSRSGHLRTAVLYLVLTLILCCLASWGGFCLMI